MRILRYDYHARNLPALEMEKIHITGTKIFSRESDIPDRSSRISYDQFDTRAQVLKDISMVVPAGGI